MTLQELEIYFQTTATNHKQLKEFTWYTLEELTDRIHQDLQFPCLGLEEPLANTGGQGYANIRFNQNSAFMVFAKVDDSGDHDQIRTQKDLCASISKDVITKMIKDRKRWDAGEKDFVLPGLDHDGFTLEFMPQLLHGFIVGCRVTFRINEPMEEFTLDHWDNEMDFDI